MTGDSWRRLPALRWQCVPLLGLAPSPLPPRPLSLQAFARLPVLWGPGGPGLICPLFSEPFHLGEVCAWFPGALVPGAMACVTLRPLQALQAAPSPGRCGGARVRARRVSVSRASGLPFSSMGKGFLLFKVQSLYENACWCVLFGVDIHDYVEVFFMWFEVFYLRCSMAGKLLRVTRLGLIAAPRSVSPATPARRKSHLCF